MWFSFWVDLELNNGVSFYNGLKLEIITRHRCFTMLLSTNRGVIVQKANGITRTFVLRRVSAARSSIRMDLARGSLPSLQVLFYFY